VTSGVRAGPRSNRTGISAQRPRRWHEERRIGGSYRRVLAKGIYVPQNAVVLEIGPGRGSWTRALLKRAYERVRSTLWIFTMWLSGFSRKSTMEG
jgi:hypothetical protein